MVSDHYSIILMESSSLSFQRVSTHRPIRKRMASSHAKHIKEFIKVSCKLFSHLLKSTNIQKMKHRYLLSAHLQNNSTYHKISKEQEKINYLAFYQMVDN